MRAQVKCESEVRLPFLVIGRCRQKPPPALPPQERDKRNRGVKQRLFDVFRKYAGRG